MSRVLKVGRSRQHHKRARVDDYTWVFPRLVLNGAWLTEAGFRDGDSVTVETIADGELRISKRRVSK